MNSSHKPDSLFFGKPSRSQESSHSTAGAKGSWERREHLFRLLNSALLASLSPPQSANLTQQFEELSHHPLLSCLLDSLELYRLQNDLTEEQALQGALQFFEKLQKVWHDFLIVEGLQRVRSHLLETKSSLK